MLKRIVFLLLLLPSLPVLANSHHPQEFLEKIKGTKDEGQQIAQHFCLFCHAKDAMIELGAPKIGRAEDWAPRLKAGYSDLFQHTAEGMGAMPPRGGCFECTDEQLRLAIEVLLPQNANK